MVQPERQCGRRHALTAQILGDPIADPRRTQCAAHDIADGQLPAERAVDLDHERNHRTAPGLGLQTRPQRRPVRHVVARLPGTAPGRLPRLQMRPVAQPDPAPYRRIAQPHRTQCHLPGSDAHRSQMRGPTGMLRDPEHVHRLHVSATLCEKCDPDLVTGPDLGVVRVDHDQTVRLGQRGEQMRRTPAPPPSGCTR